jgi:hypothetical protein
MQFFQADAKTYQTLQTKPELHDGGARASIDSEALEEAKSLPPSTALHSALAQI